MRGWRVFVTRVMLLAASGWMLLSSLVLGVAAYKSHPVWFVAASSLLLVVLGVWQFFFVVFGVSTRAVGDLLRLVYPAMPLPAEAYWDKVQRERWIPSWKRRLQ